jgi:hypothetical protein
MARGIFVRFFGARKPYLVLNRPERFREQRVSGETAMEAVAMSTADREDARGVRRCSEKRAAGARFAEEVLTLFSTAFTRSQADGATKHSIG